MRRISTSPGMQHHGMIRSALVDWLDAFNMKTTKMKDGPLITLVPLPSSSQFLNVIESVFGVMKKAIIHHSDYERHAPDEVCDFAALPREECAFQG